MQCLLRFFTLLFSVAPCWGVVPTRIVFLQLFKGLTLFLVSYPLLFFFRLTQLAEQSRVTRFFGVVWFIHIFVSLFYTPPFSLCAPQSKAPVAYVRRIQHHSHLLDPSFFRTLAPTLHTVECRWGESNIRTHSVLLLLVSLYWCFAFIWNIPPCSPLAPFIHLQNSLFVRSIFTPCQQSFSCSCFPNGPRSSSFAPPFVYVLGFSAGEWCLACFYTLCSPGFPEFFCPHWAWTPHIMWGRRLHFAVFSLGPFFPPFTCFFLPVLTPPPAPSSSPFLLHLFFLSVFLLYPHVSFSSVVPRSGWLPCLPSGLN